MSDMDGNSDPGNYDDDNMEDLDDNMEDNESEGVSSRSGDSSNEEDEDEDKNSDSDADDSQSENGEYAEEGQMQIIQASNEDQPQSKKRVTPPFLTKYELARIIGTRALQIAQNSPIYVEIDEKDYDPIQIAEKEFIAGKIPFIVRRFLPNKQFEDWTLSELKEGMTN